LNGIRVGKYAFLAASIIIEIFILLVVAAPVLGAVTPQVSSHADYGIGVELNTIQPQLQNYFDGGLCADELGAPGQNPCAFTVEVPAFNNWFLAGSVALSISFAVNGTTVYQTPKASLSLAPFQSGTIDVVVNVPVGVVSQMQGQQISGGGQMTLEEAGLWSITVGLGQ